jgi:hypothetical protein
MRRASPWLLASTLAVVTVALGLGPGRAWVQACAGSVRAGFMDRDATPTSEGHHLRLQTELGPVHVWWPSGYEVERAGTVVYVHGYATDVDRAWREHRLAEQFRDSERNALFVAPEAPSASGEQLRWERLADLLGEVAVSGQLELPRGPIIGVAHSGGYRSLLPWLASPMVDAVVLLDGFYGREREFAEWLAVRSQPSRSLVLVGFHTSLRTEQFLQTLPGSLVIDGLPDLKRARALGKVPGRLFYVRSTVGHMELVTEGKAMPAMLQFVGLGAVEGGRSSF